MPKTIGDQVAELGRPSFACEKHGPIKIDTHSISKWSDTQWYVYCPGCGRWLGFAVETKKN